MSSGADLLSPPLPLAVALSGGADSVALLLHCTARWPGRVWAVHVHHGLQAAADGFEAHCRALCTRMGIPLVVQRLSVQATPGQSPEDAARVARYRALREAMGAPGGMPGTRTIALGHHADDQVETLILALSRGAGLRGMSAMPRCIERDGLCYYRPFLSLNAAQIRQGLQAQGVAWVEDPTNDHLCYTRNRIRAQVMPALEAAFPGFRQTFARSAAHAAQAQMVLDEVAAADLAEVGTPPGIRALQGLSRARQANVLRHWLRSACGTNASTAQLEELLHQVDACRTRGQQIHIKVGTGFVRRSMDCLDWYNPEV